MLALVTFTDFTTTFRLVNSVSNLALRLPSLHLSTRTLQYAYYVAVRDAGHCVCEPSSLPL